MRRHLLDARLGELPDHHHSDARPGMTMFRLPMTIWGMFSPPSCRRSRCRCLPRPGSCSSWIASWELVSSCRKDISPTTQRWRPRRTADSLAAPVLVLFASCRVHHDPAGNGHGERHHRLLLRKPLFGYKPMVYSISGIAGLGFIVWGHHMFVSGMNPCSHDVHGLDDDDRAAQRVKVFNWLGTIWGGKIQFTTPMLFALSFVSMFIIGGLSAFSWLPRRSTSLFTTPTSSWPTSTTCSFRYGDGRFRRDLLLVSQDVRPHDERALGKVHFFLTFLFLNGTFYTMHILGAVGFPRRLADPYEYETFRHLLPMNQFMSICAICMVATQVIFAFNFLYSMFFDRSSPQSMGR